MLKNAVSVAQTPSSRPSAHRRHRAIVAIGHSATIPTQAIMPSNSKPLPAKFSQGVSARRPPAKAAGSSPPMAGVFLDAAGQAAVINIGHGRHRKSAGAMAEQSSQTRLLRTLRSFHSAPRGKNLPRAFCNSLHRTFRTVAACISPLEARKPPKTAIKLARQYHLENSAAPAVRSNFTPPELSRQYLGGDVRKRKTSRARAAYPPIAARVGPHRCVAFLITPIRICRTRKYGVACRPRISPTFLLRGPLGESSAAFIFEPVVGATPRRCRARRWLRLRRIAKICRENKNPADCR